MQDPTQPTLDNLLSLLPDLPWHRQEDYVLTAADDRLVRALHLRDPYTDIRVLNLLLAAPALFGAATQARQYLVRLNDPQASRLADLLLQAQHLACAEPGEPNPNFYVAPPDTD